MTQSEPPVDAASLLHDEELDRRAQRLATIAWLLILGCFAGLVFVDRDTVPGAWWAIGVGMLMLLHSLARKLDDLPVSGFSLIISGLILATGIVSLLGVSLPLVPILLILVGSTIALRHLFERH